LTAHPLEPDAAEMRRLVDQAMRRIVAHIESLPSQPSAHVEGATEFARTLIEPLPRRGEDYDAVGRVLDGDESRVRRLTFEPGTLSIFHGRRALHRVTRCAGTRDRLVAILCFASEPRAVNSDAVRKLYWGRTK